MSQKGDVTEMGLSCDGPGLTVFNLMVRFSEKSEPEPGDSREQ